MFYKHPPSEAYGLNKLLFESRHSDVLRHRIVNDFEKVADEYELKGQQRQAARAMIDVGSGGLVSDHVKPLAEAGAHAAAGADVAARHLLDDPQARAGGDGAGSQAIGKGAVRAGGRESLVALAPLPPCPRSLLAPCM